MLTERGPLKLLPGGNVRIESDGPRLRQGDLLTLEIMDVMCCRHRTNSIFHWNRAQAPTRMAWLASCAPERNQEFASA
jgi:hypothetical protein